VTTRLNRFVALAAITVCSAWLAAQGPSQLGLEEVFADYWGWRLADSPELATFMGRTDYNDRWTDMSKAARDKRRAELQEYLQKALYFAEFEAGNRIHKYTPADGKFVVFADNVGVNGLTMDDKGMILAASQDMQRVTRFDPVTAVRTQLPGADRYMGKPFNAVNDVMARADGNIYFSDPTFMQNNRPGQGVTAVYRLWNGVVTRITTGKQPNALHISLDGKWLYITSSGGEPVRRFPLNADGSVGPEGPSLAGPSESLALDCAGNLYLSSDGKIRVYTAEGMPIGTFANISAGITNLTFGDEDGRTLYIAARGALYKIRLQIPGLPN